MTIEQTQTDAQSPQSNFKFPFLGSHEWLKPFSASPVNSYVAAWHDALGFVASRLQEQADYAKNMAECSDPAEALKCHAEFVQNSLKRSYADGSKIFDTLRASFSSAQPGK